MAAPKYDIERLLSDLLGIVSANLNNKLVAINTEKNDGITLLPWDGTAFLQDLSKSDGAASPFFLFYGVNDAPAAPIGPATALTVEAFFILVFMDTAEDKTYMLRLFRYLRAMQEIFQDNYTAIPAVAKLLVSRIAPASFAQTEGGTYRATGVLIKTAIA